VKPTRWQVLVAIGVAVAALSWGGLRILERQRPDAVSGSWLAVPWTVPVALAFVAAGVLVAALSLRARLRGTHYNPRTKPLDPLFAARMAALAKAVSHVGAALAGVYAGVAVFLAPSGESELRRERLWMALLALGASGLLVVAGLVLERVCRVKPPKDEASLPPTP
jgi:hypothetical protein